MPFFPLMIHNMDYVVFEHDILVACPTGAQMIETCKAGLKEIEVDK